VDLGAAVVADEGPFELVEPGEGSLDDPAVAAEAGPVLGAAASDFGCDAAAAELATVALVVVAAVGAQSARSSARPADLAAHRWHTVDKRDELGDVMAVAAGDCPGKREPRRVYEKVVLRPVSGSINRARARFGAPFFACT
jgi:hypothetical protein